MSPKNKYDDYGYWHKPNPYTYKWLSVDECIAARTRVPCTNHMVGQHNPKPLMGYERLFLSN